jgi:hypothetical protein
LGNRSREEPDKNGSAHPAIVDDAPHQPALVTAVALVAGGTYLVYYWGLASAFDMGSWGFKLGIYR